MHSQLKIIIIIIIIIIIRKLIIHLKNVFLDNNDTSQFYFLNNSHQNHLRLPGVLVIFCFWYITSYVTKGVKKMKYFDTGQ